MKVAVAVAVRARQTPERTVALPRPVRVELETPARATEAKAVMMRWDKQEQFVAEEEEAALHT